MEIIEITDFSNPNLDAFARLTERQLMNRDKPEDGLFIAESPLVIHRALDAGYEPVTLLMERKHIEGQAADVIARCGVPVYTAPLDVLERITGCAERTSPPWRRSARMPAASLCWRTS